MHKLRIPSGISWELLVVNNNCTDETDAVIARHESHLPIRRLYESKAGLSNARNCAVRGASGELMLWTDDDVLVDRDWLAEYVRAATRWPAVSFFGGPIHPWFSNQPTAWFQAVWEKVANIYGLRDLGAESVEFTQASLPFGANYGVRSEIQQRYRYDPNFGVSPHKRIAGEETVLLRAMIADGLAGRWVPEAKLKHFVSPEQQTIGFLRRCYHGRGATHVKWDVVSGAPMLFGKPRWLWRAFVEAHIKYCLFRPFSKPEVWIDTFIAMHKSRGAVFSCSGNNQRNADRM